MLLFCAWLVYWFVFFRYYTIFCSVLCSYNHGFGWEKCKSWTRTALKWPIESGPNFIKILSQKYCLKNFFPKRKLGGVPATTIQTLCDLAGDLFLLSRTLLCLAKLTDYWLYGMEPRTLLEKGKRGDMFWKLIIQICL